MPESVEAAERRRERDRLRKEQRGAVSSTYDEYDLLVVKERRRE